jgi:hypothetical protein
MEYGEQLFLELDAVRMAARKYLERSKGYKYNETERDVLSRLVAGDGWEDPHAT